MKEEEYLPEYKVMKETMDELNLNKTHIHGDFHMKNMVYDAKSGGILCGILWKTCSSICTILTHRAQGNTHIYDFCMCI